MLEVIPIRAFQDNYLWLFKPQNGVECGIVDPGDAGPVLEYIEDNGLRLAVIFVTHHHADHTGGISRLLQAYDVPVYGPASPNIPSVTNPLRGGDSVEMFGEVFHILEIPGHTLDHIAYYTETASDNCPPLLFCGDTLFAGGCGRVFEGTFSMMHASLQKLAALSPDTKVYCAHEYTMANLAFAKAVTPGNSNLESRIQKEQEKRNRDIPTVPTSIRVELETNPFLRCSEDEVIGSASSHSGHSLRKPEDVFAEIRSWKDSF